MSEFAIKICPNKSTMVKSYSESTLLTYSTKIEKKNKKLSYLGVTGVVTSFP